MKTKTILLTGTSGFVGFNFLKFALKNNFKVIDILRDKNKKNKRLIFIRKNYKKNTNLFFLKDIKN